MTTRSTPEFPYEAQTELWNTRRKHNRLAGIPIIEDFEESYIRSLSSEEATEKLAVAETAYETFEKKQAKKKKKKKQAASASEAVDTSEHGSTSDPEHGSASDPELASDLESEHQDGTETPKGTVNVLSEEPTDTSPKDKIPSEPSDSSSDSSSEEDDPRNRTSKKDKRAIRGTTPRIKEHSGKPAKLFKMEPPKKYSGDKDNERTYDAVQLFLSQLSRYFRLATNVDMRKDISEYTPSFIDGFAYRWSS